MQSFCDLSAASRSSEKEEEQPFWYGYHRDAHTSIVGIRESMSCAHTCFRNDEEVDAWLKEGNNKIGPRSGQLGLFAYPGQSNMTGRRLPLDW